MRILCCGRLSCFFERGVKLRL
uniref:Uncharacterized protein n=1 Tax=Anguilla anguilla TaxID=7936 RepID=A0A0E9UK35_ANGAN